MNGRGEERISRLDRTKEERIERKGNNRIGKGRERQRRKGEEKI